MDETKKCFVSWGDILVSSLYSIYLLRDVAILAGKKKQQNKKPGHSMLLYII